MEVNVNTIFDSYSTEVQEVFYAFEKAVGQVKSHLSTHKFSLETEVFFDNRKVCKLLGVSQRTLQDYRDKGVIPFYKIEGKILYAQSDIIRMLERNYNDSWKLKR